MNDKVSCINNFSSRCYRDFRVDFENLIHCLAHNFNIPFNASSEQSIIAERGVFFWSIHHKRFNL